VSNQEILDNAPDGATHVDSESDYYKINENVTEVMLNSLWFSAEDALILPIRSLADIKRIAELEKDLFTQSQESKDAVKRAIEIILEKDERIAELEQEKKLMIDFARNIFIGSIEQFNQIVESKLKAVQSD
jgi:hypothetical protein